MNINEHYFKTSPEDRSLNTVENDSITSHYVVINTVNRSYEKESMWRLRIKFGIEGNKLMTLPIYANDPTFPSGHTVNGISYYPWSLNEDAKSGRDMIVGFKSVMYSGESGCIISQRMRDITKIDYIRIELPRVLIESIPNFNHILNISIDELSGFSNTYIPNNDDISFVTTLTETTPSSLVYTSYANMYFKSSINLQSLSLNVTNALCNLGDFDSLSICHIRINNMGRLEIITDDIPESFNKTHRVLLPNINLTSETANSNMEYEHTCTVIDGYIRDATVVVRELNGNIICKLKSDSGGICIPKFKNGSKVLIFSANGGIDISYNKQNVIEFRSIYLPSSSINEPLNITPLTTLVTDYVVYIERNNREISQKFVLDVYRNFKNILSVEGINSDYIATNNIRAAVISYRIVSIIKVANTLLKSFTDYMPNSSYVTTKLALKILDKSFDMLNSDILEEFLDMLINEQKGHHNLKDYRKIKKSVTDSLINHMCFDKEELSFELLGKASLVLHNDLEKKSGKIVLFDEKIKSYDEIVDIRRQIDPESGDIIPDLPVMEVRLELSDNMSDVLKYNIERVRTILSSIITSYLPMIEEKAQSTIKIEEKEFDKMYGISRSYWNDRRIEINSLFMNNKIDGRFSLNGVECHLYTIILLREILNILGYNKLECKFENEIMGFSLNQYSRLSFDTLECLENMGYIVNYDSVFLKDTDIIDDIKLKGLSLRFLNERYENEIRVSRGDKRIYVGDSDSVLDFGKNKPIECVEVVKNTPIYDLRDKCSINSLDLLCEKESITIKLLIESSIGGTVYLQPRLTIDNIFQESKEPIRKKVRNGLKNNVSLEFRNNIDLIKNGTHKLKVEIEFYFGSFSTHKVTLVNTYLIKNAIEWMNLPILEFRNSISGLEELERLEESTLYNENRAYSEPVLIEEQTEAIDGNGDIVANDSNNLPESFSKNILKVVYSGANAYLLKHNGFIIVDNGGVEISSVTNLNRSYDLIVGGTSVFVLCDNGVHAYNIADGTLRVSYTSNIAKCWCGTYSDVSNTLIIFLDYYQYEAGEIRVLDIDIDNSGSMTIMEVSRMNIDRIDLPYRAICNTETKLEKVYLINRQKNYLMQIDFKDPNLPVIEDSYSSDLMKEPRSLVYIESKNLLIVGCYISKMVLVFKTDLSYSVPLLIRAIGMINKPSDMTYYEDGLSLDLYVCTNEKSNKSIDKIRLYDNEGDLQVFNQPIMYRLNKEIGYNSIYYDGNDNIICISYGSGDVSGVIDKYDSDDFDSSNVGFPYISEIDCSGKEYEIYSINRDISGYHILELDKMYDDSNINLEIDGKNRRVLNKDLQITYTINMTSQILLDKKI